MILDIIQILLLLFIIYLLFTKQSSKQIIGSAKKQIERLMPDKTRIIEWQPPVDGAVEAGKKIIAGIKKKYGKN